MKKNEIQEAAKCLSRSGNSAAVNSKIFVLCFTGFYLPGFKGGGPIRTITNLIDTLGGEIQFVVVTSDRDLGDAEPYSIELKNQVQRAGKANIFYLSSGANWICEAFNIIHGFQGDILYLNSFFSFRFSIVPMIIWRLFKSGKPVIIGPRGEFSEGALAFKSVKKKCYIYLVKKLGIYRRVIWQASTQHDAEDIQRVIGKDVKIRVAVNIACPPRVLELTARQAGTALRLVLVSRISPMKNLLGALQVLQRVQCPLVFDVYGPIEDGVYWTTCQELIKQLPKNISFNYGGMLYPAQVPETLAKYDLFYLPSLGENFGHVIAEALGCGLPVLISTATPWRDLAKNKLGWDIPLDQTDQFVSCIESCNRISAADYDAWRRSIRTWALENIGNEEAVEQNRQLFIDLELLNG